MPRRRSSNSSRLFGRLFAVALASLCAHAGVYARQAGAPAQQTHGTIEGRVVSGERGLAGVAVVLLPAEFSPNFKPAARATSDAEGRYRLSSVPPGRYNVYPLAAAFIVEGLELGWPPGRPVTVAPGESIEDIDFKLARGGVITGRVTDADGKPVVAEQIHLVPLEERGRFRQTGMHRNAQTDDRGIYRLFGLQPGRYRVGVGHDSETASVRMGGAGRFYARTYHPSETEVAQAKIVEVLEGGEATDVDITLGKPERMFKARGRVVFAATNQPAAGVQFGYGAMQKGTNQMGAFGGGMMTDARGEFEIATLLPGQRYGVFATSEADTDWYSDVATFEVTDADVSGIEVKLHRGASLSGTVAIEGVADRAALARLLPRVNLFAAPSGGPGREDLAAPRFNVIKVAADGSWRTAGLRPGKVRVVLGGYPPVRGLSLLRVEREGGEVRDGVEVAEGSHVAGVRVVLAYGTGVVRGQVVLKNGDQPAVLPENISMYAMARPNGQNTTGGRRPVRVDARGRFLIDGLPAGGIEVMVYTTGPTRPARATQVVSVPEGGEVSVTVTLDLAQVIKPDER